METEINRAFYDLVVKERDYELARARKFELELWECKEVVRAVLALLMSGLRE